MTFTRKTHDDLTPACRQYMIAFVKKNRTEGTVPMEVFVANMIEHGVLVAHGEPGTPFDKMTVVRAPGLTDEEFTEGFNQLAHYMEDDAS
jgi:hypothetical protein